MDLTTPEMREILAAVGVAKRGKPGEGRKMLLELWEKYSPRREPLQICAMAHTLADTETDVATELEWDLRALEAATGSREAQDRDTLPPVPEIFLPSLHLNISDCYRRLGDIERTRLHARFASNRAGALLDDDYGRQLRESLRRMNEYLATV